MNRDAARLAAAIEVTSRAASRLRSSIEDDQPAILEAISAEARGLGADSFRALDAFVQRFRQVHEHMTHRLYPALFRSEELGARPPPMLRLLGWLQDVGLIEDARWWGRYAEARNRLIHEYPLDASDRAEALQAALAYSSALLADFDRALIYTSERGLLTNV